MYKRFQRFFEYDIESNERVIRSLRSVPEGRRDAESFARAVDIFAHMHEARALWLSRMHGGPRPDALFPRDVSLADAEARFAEVNELWRPFIAELSDARLRQIVDYTAYEGDRYSNRVEDILTQLFGHGWYHRGQIAMLVRQAGGKPAVTDWIFATREPLQ